MKSEKKKIVDRLARIEGQIKGVRGMIEKEEDCQRVVVQIMAIKEAIQKAGLELMKAKVCSRKTLQKRDLEAIFKVMK
ncbi:MAG: metal-sensitive transcriptional regulator [Patescibacteria group bacterium]